MSKRKLKPDEIYSLSEKKIYHISKLTNIEKITTANGRLRVQGITPGGKVVSKFISKEMAGSGLLGNLLGMPDGIPGLSNLPLIGALF